METIAKYSVCIQGPSENPRDYRVHCNRGWGDGLLVTNGKSKYGRHVTYEEVVTSWLQCPFITLTQLLESRTKQMPPCLRWFSSTPFSQSQLLVFYRIFISTEDFSILTYCLVECNRIKENNKVLMNFLKYTNMKLHLQR